MGFQDVLHLVELIKASSNFSEIRLRSGDFEIELRRHGSTAPISSPPVSTLRAQPQGESTVAPVQPPGEPHVAAPPPSAAPAPVQRRAEQEGTTVIRAPMVGTVYHAPEPGAAPFVTVGQRVSPQDQVCIVEVMKLMNSITAGCHGVLSEILVSDGQQVEHGQALFVITVD